MRTTTTAAIILAIALTLILPLYRGTAVASTACVSELSGDGSLAGRWIQDESIDCPSVHRHADDDAPRAGIYLARYYTFSLSEAADVTITLESPADTYLYLLEGAGMNGTALHKNDDIDRSSRNFNSRIDETLDAGDYTIEATTYDAVYPTAGVEFTLTVSGIAPQASAEDDRAVLTALYHATDGDNWTDNDGWLTDEPLGAWEGVETNEDGRVIGLALDDNNLSGQMLSELGNLTALENMALEGNQLTGAIPAELGNLTKLRELDLSYNQLAGAIPSELGAPINLEVLNLSNNQLTGAIPAELGNLSRLRSFALIGNQLTGCVPAALRDVEDNDFAELGLPFCEDTAPPEPTPAECTQPLGIAPVEGAWISGGCISRNRTENGIHYARYYTFTLGSGATIELTLESRADPYLILLDDAGEIIAQDDDDDEGNFNLSARDSGIRITLESGDYTVEATTYGGEDTGDFTLTLDRPELAALRALYHATEGDSWDNNDNWLSDAPLSDWHGIRTDDESRVVEIYLNDNNLSGEIPVELGRLSHLEGIHLARNSLSGTIPQELGDLQNLKVLMLFDNDLTGSIPSQFGSLDNLEEVHFDRNRLSGSIPSQFGSLSNLQQLRLTANELSGRIPESLGRLANLRQLSLAANNLSGAVPAELANLENLTHLHLWDNNLTAEEFVQRIGDMDNLEFLDIGGNRINGAQVLAQADNIRNLTGLGIHDSNITDDDLLEYMDDLHSLKLDFLNIGANGLSDRQILARLANMKTLQRLAIHDNEFSGELPRTMIGLPLRIFYFHNNAGVCAPADAEFQDWLSDMHRYNGDICAGGTPTRAPSPASGIADQFAAILQTTQQPAPPHSLSALADGQYGG